MGHEQFVAIMPYISADLVNMIAQKQNITEADALNKLYSSRLYGLLEKEETKVWHYSATMIAQLFEDERSGNLVLPEVM